MCGTGAGCSAIKYQPLQASQVFQIVLSSCVRMQSNGGGCKYFGHMGGGDYTEATRDGEGLLALDQCHRLQKI
jgi:hypothetical protein